MKNTVWAVLLHRDHEGDELIAICADRDSAIDIAIETESHDDLVTIRPCELGVKINPYDGADERIK